MPKTQFIAFLRGINVGGHTVKMEELRRLLTEFGLQEVRTYIQTGNVFFVADSKERKALSEKLPIYLQEKLGWPVPVFLRTQEELEKVVARQAFQGQNITPETRLLVLFLEKPLPAGAELVPASPRESFELLHHTPGEAFVVMHLTQGKPGNPAALLERKYKLKTTVRFFGTTAKILQACKGTGT